MSLRTLSLPIIALLLAGCGDAKNEKNAPAAGNARYVQNVSHVIEAGPAAGTKAPDFSWYDGNGTKVSLSEVAKGRPVLINFWATWCGPCVREIPDLVALNEEYAAKGALIIGVSVDQDDDVLTLVSGFAKEKGMTYPVIIDNGDIAKAYGGIQGIPTTFYVDRNGVIRNTLVGMRDKETFAKEFDAVM